MTKKEAERDCVSNIHIAKQDIMKGRHEKVILTKNGKEAMVLMSIKLFNENQNHVDYLELKVSQLEEELEGFREYDLRSELM